MKREPLSARVVALLGLLLALVSAVEQGFIDRFAKPGAWWEDAEGHVALGLTVALIIASAWFSADLRRVKKWSQIAGDLRTRSMDVESLHPDTIAEALASSHELIEAGALGDDLQAAVAEVNTTFVEGRRMPDLDRIKHLETVTTRVLAETRPRPESAPPEAQSAEAAAAWQSVARLRAATRQTRIELEAIQARPPIGAAQTVDTDRDPQHRWTELVALATVLIGLIAAPSVADELTGDDRAGSAPSTTTTIPDSTTTSVDPVAELEAQVVALGRAIEDLRNEPPVTITVPAEQQGLAGIVSQLQRRDDLQAEITVRPGDNLWNLARDVCDNDGSAREIAADVISIWNANTERIGADPNDLPSEDEILIDCAD